MTKITQETVQQRVSDYAQNLGNELQTLAGDSALEGIVAGHYLYDGSVMRPSKGIVAMIAFVILRDDQLKKELEELSENDGFALVARKIAATPPEKISTIVTNHSRLIVRESLWYADREGGLDKAILWNLVDAFNEAKTGIDRSICEGAINRLVSLALIERDHAFLHSLAEVSEALNTGEMAPADGKSRIIIGMLIYRSALREKLERIPTKSELRYFAHAAWKELSDKDLYWNKAYAESGITFPPDRKSPRLTEARRMQFDQWAQEFS